VRIGPARIVFWLALAVPGAMMYYDLVGRWANNRVENSHVPFWRRERATPYQTFTAQLR